MIARTSISVPRVGASWHKRSYYENDGQRKDREIAFPQSSASWFASTKI
jgi:hypothetical protein